MTQAIVVAGGLGSRMSNALGGLPKCLAEINGISLLEYCFRSLSRSNLTKVTLLLSHQAEPIIKASNVIAEKWGIDISYHAQENLLGTAGAIIDAQEVLEDNFIVIYGDLYLDTCLEEITQLSSREDVDFAQIVHPSSHIFDSDIVVINKNNEIVEYCTKPHPSDLVVRNLCNAGIYFFKKSIFANFPRGKKIDLDRELLPQVLKKGKRGIALRHTGTVKDAGTPERLLELEKTVKRNVNPKIKAIFFDRDGTLIKEKAYLVNSKELELFEDTAQVLRKCNNLGILTLVVTNQPAIARGILSEENLDHIHNSLDTLLAQEGAWIDEYYYCPHHPDSGFENERTELKMVCECRKPETKLFRDALARWNIKVNESVMVGNTWRDKEAARSLGIKYFEVQEDLLQLGMSLDDQGNSLGRWLDKFLE